MKNAEMNQAIRAAAFRRTHTELGAAIQEAATRGTIVIPTPAPCAMTAAIKAAAGYAPPKEADHAEP